jgi:arylformamidase
MRLFDITRPLQPGMAVWPGDQAYYHFWTSEMRQGAAANVSAILLSVHTGTHADAPLHFIPNGLSIDNIPLEVFVGPAVVVDCSNVDVISPDVVEDRLKDVAQVQRVLFRTRSSLRDNFAWEVDFPYFLPETIDLLAERSVVLIGTDAPSVDPFDSEDLPVHHRLSEKGIVNLENLLLKDVEPGSYQLFALPLKLEGLDGAPVRAILVKD